MNFCSNCAHPVSLSIPPGDNRPRYCCSSCNAIHYQNPRAVVGTLPVMGDQVLLCKRAIEPRYGYWTLPAGFMENGETTDEGASRETLEEAGARVELQGLYSVIDVPHVDQIHMFFRARLLNTDFDPGTESLEVKLFNEADVPWDQIAFRTVAQTLRWFFEDRSLKASNFVLHTSSLRFERKP